MTSEKQTSWIDTARRRAMLVAALIAAVTFFWIALVVYTNLSAIVMTGIGILSVLLLSVASAWAILPVSRRQSMVEGAKPS